MADPVVCSFLTKLLCAHSGRMALQDLPRHIALPGPQLDDVLREAGTDHFVLAGDGPGGVEVVAVSAVRLCPRYLRGECLSCHRLHLCKLFILGKCGPRPRRAQCEFSHDIHTEGNQAVLKAHNLNGLNQEELRILLLQNDPFLLPEVCSFYNKGEGPHGSCHLQGRCSRLHVCRHFVQGECRYSKCKRSHGLVGPATLQMLQTHGLSPSTALNIQAICGHRTAELFREFLEKRASTNRERSQIRKSCQDIPSASNPASPSKSSSPKGPRPGSVDKPARDEDKSKSDDICLYYVWRFCKHKSSCRNIHYHLPYCWQVKEGGLWKNLPKMEEIEKAFCDPNNASLGSRNIDFQKMTCASAPVKRLSTPSSVRNPSLSLTTKWRWYWMNEHGQWIEYGKEGSTQQTASLTSLDLETVFLANPKDTVDFRAGSQMYKIDFEEMVQRNLVLRTKREVRRRPEFVSSADVDNIKKRSPGSSGPDILAGTFPDTWDKKAVPEVGFKLVDLAASTPEHQKVVKQFQETMSRFTVRKVWRVQNLALWQVFQWQKEQMRKANGGKEVAEKLLFHGTAPAHRDAICHHNFDWRICGTHGTRYGKGSYFAKDASYSHNYSQAGVSGNNDVKTMFLARVLVGDFTLGNPTLVRPPPRPEDPGRFYDSCVDCTPTPAIFVIFEKHQIYPEYIIEYTAATNCVLQ
ncbi:zinc finger CCCH-type antiviral protein 1-like [Tachyglossus aculeatus]|uniref:zinc finger CCCH-type antiviral protein 1-like n=1 Tax=Tachyglossus aculeatus TaxID=9261 RepID=UPI0018F4C821|nr:zinc finger CCCH-type antiviral protein 1-like [Tachyglossus aculeatus]